MSYESVDHNFNKVVSYRIKRRKLSFNCMQNAADGHAYGASAAVSENDEQMLASFACDIQCSGNSNISVHESANFGERPFACGVCEFQSAQRGDLNLHKRTHSGERPFACDECDIDALKVAISKITSALILASGRSRATSASIDALKVAI